MNQQIACVLQTRRLNCDINSPRNPVPTRTILRGFVVEPEPAVADVADAIFRVREPTCILLKLVECMLLAMGVTMSVSQL